VDADCGRERKVAHVVRVVLAETSRLARAHGLGGSAGANFFECTGGDDEGSG
jgi:hypothetical protein